MPSNAPPSSKTCHRAYKDIWVRVINLSESGRFQNPLGIAGVFFHLLSSATLYNKPRYNTDEEMAPHSKPNGFMSNM